MKATEQYFPVVPFILLYKVVITFDKHKSNSLLQNADRDTASSSIPKMMGFEIQIRDTCTHSKGASMDGVADPRKGPGEPAPPYF